jgi:hypothetical protein
VRRNISVTYSFAILTHGCKGFFFAGTEWVLMVIARFCSVAPVDMTHPSFEAGCDRPLREQRRFSRLALDGGSNDGCERSDGLSFLSNYLPTSSKRLDDAVRREKLLDINVPRNITIIVIRAFELLQVDTLEMRHGERAPS